MLNLLSLDAFQLTRYITSRFNTKLIKSDLNEIRDLSFQILGNKEGFSSDSRSLLKIYYTLVRAYHNGILENKLNKTFPYRHNIYESYVNNTSSSNGPSIDGNISNSSVPNDPTDDSRDYSDKVVDSCCEYLNKTVNKIILDSFKCDFMQTLKNYLYNVKDDRVVLLKLCVKLLIEFWTKNTLDTGLINSIRGEILLNLDQIREIIVNMSSNLADNSTRTVDIKFDKSNDRNYIVNNVSVDGTNNYVKNVSNLIEAHLLLILTNSYSEDLIYNFVKAVSINFNHITPQEKLRVFYGLSSVPESEAVNNLLSRFVVYFYRNVNLLQLSDVTLLVNSYAKLRHQNRVLDKIVDVHLIPKFNNITIVDLFILLDCFVELDYRCSAFTRNIDDDFMKSLKKQDELILKSKLQQLHSNVKLS